MVSSEEAAKRRGCPCSDVVDVGGQLVTTVIYGGAQTRDILGTGWSMFITDTPAMAHGRREKTI